MTDINQKEEWRKYNTSKEFSKDLKFNKKWYHLTAIFDKDQNGEDFDFNDNSVESDDFDFNRTLDQAFEYEPDIYLDSVKFDFNSVLMEKYKITEIGLIMSELNENNSIINQDTPRYDITNITNNNSFIKFYNAINSSKFNGFYVKSALAIYDINDDSKPIESITDETKFKNEELAKNIFSTILKAGGGYTNEATLELLGNINKDKNYDPNTYKNLNIIELLSRLTIINHINANIFPDAIYNDESEIIPVDLKVAYSSDLEKDDVPEDVKINHKINVASGANYRYMTGIYNALINTIRLNKKTLMNYINDTKITNIKNAEIMPELKGFLLFSLTAYNPKRSQLDFSGLCMRSLISCIHGRSKKPNDCLFAAKSRNGQGGVKYDNGSAEIYKDSKSILYKCPERFANVIKNFYTALYKDYNVIYDNIQLNGLVDGITPNGVEEICKAIGIKEEKIN